MGGSENVADAHYWDRSNTERVLGFGLWVYDTREFPLQTAGNIYFKGAQPYSKEKDFALCAQSDPEIKIVDEGPRVHLQFKPAQAAGAARTKLVTTKLLGNARMSGVAYEEPDGSALKIDTDYFGNKRNKSHPTPGPFENPAGGQIQVW